MWGIARALGILMLTISFLLFYGTQTRESNRIPALDSIENPFSPLIYSSFAFEKEEGEEEDDEEEANYVFNSAFSTTTNENPFMNLSLRYDFYYETCPQAEKIIQSMIRALYTRRPEIAPALLRLLFHDCFIQGCDASVLLDAIDGVEAEKDTPPNQTLKGFDVIELIKSKIEQVCPATVSCADILALATREGVVLAGGPFYPLYTGRRDSLLSFPEVARTELPSPHEDLPKTLNSFANKGFNERETVSLLGAHNIGFIHCQFFWKRLYNYTETGGPDPTLDTDLLNEMRSKCNNSKGSDLSREPGVVMNYQGAQGPEFGTHYYSGLLHKKGILHADQQLMASNETAKWVQYYASDSFLFQRDFAQVMMKLSNYRVLTKPLGEVRLQCSKRNPTLDSPDDTFSPSMVLEKREMDINANLALSTTTKNPFMDTFLRYDFYRDTCPQAEKIIQSTVHDLYKGRPELSANLLRLLFHDCFIMGCDGSVLLDPIDGVEAEKNAVPNLSLTGFGVIKLIKSKIEQVCLATVSCADILALATREGVTLAGGPFYPLLTGRRDSTQSYFDTAMQELPGPDDHITKTLQGFATRGLSERDVVTLLGGGHSIGHIDCKFIRSRFKDFLSTGKPDPTLPVDFLEELKANCSTNRENGSLVSYTQELVPFMPSGRSFDDHYFNALKHGRGLLFADQQLMENNTTATLVQGYSSDGGFSFRRDFAFAMIKLSSLPGNASFIGPARLSCSVARIPSG